MGDPTPLGVLTALALLVAGVSSWRVGGRFWRWAAALLVLFAVNKQLDLHSLLLESSRTLVRSQGLEAWRRPLLSLASVLVVLGASLLALVTWRRSSLLERGQPLALVGLAVIGAYGVVRALGFLRVPGLAEIGSLPIELTGCALVVIGILWSTRR